MIPSLPTVEFKAAVHDPADHYGEPGDVVQDARLSTVQKRRILEAWALDEQLLLQAEAERMHGEEQPRLREVKLALLALNQ